MKKRLTEIILLIFIVTLFSGFSVCPAETASKPIRVGFFELERFMLGPEGGEPNSGYSYDLLCEIAATNGWRYEFVYGSFSDLLDMLYAGEVDLLPCTAYTPERAEKLFYAESSAVEERYYITAKSETVLDDELQPSELAGKRIAVVVNANENKLLDDWL